MSSICLVSKIVPLSLRYKNIYLFFQVYFFKNFFKLLTADCHQLTRLVLRDCPWVDKNYYFSHFLTEGTLLELDLTGCYKITDDNIETLTGVSINLQVLKLGSIPCSLTDNAMMAIANNLKQLCSLDIRFISVLFTNIFIFCYTVLARSESQQPQLEWFTRVAQNSKQRRLQIICSRWRERASSVSSVVTIKNPIPLIRTEGRGMALKLGID